MKIILLSGGSGKRLWPLSNENRSKQFLKILKSPIGERESMIQRVWRQLGSYDLQENTIIATGKGQVDLIRSQIGTEVDIVIEPERRDTFPAIALASSYLYSEKCVDPNETIIVLPVDPFVDDLYFEKLFDLEMVIKDSVADLALMGVNPTSPSSKYGYIVPKYIENDLIYVSHFKEKPNEKDAINLVEKGALWNCGIFAFKLESLIKIIKEKSLSLSYNQLIIEYATLPKISFDYEVVEKSNKIVAISYNGKWKDLGTWDVLVEEIEHSIIGKAKISNNSKDTNIVNELDIPIIASGLDNHIIVASPDGILVSTKESSPNIKDILGDFNERPMYEERFWGWYKILDFTKYGSEREVITKRICINEGKNLSYHFHELRDETWTIINGSGIVVLDNLVKKVMPGDVIKIPKNTKHSIKAITNIEIIEVQTGAPLVDEDIKRIFEKWDDIMTEFKKDFTNN